MLRFSVILRLGIYGKPPKTQLSLNYLGRLAPYLERP